MHFAHCICKEDMQPRVSTQKHQWQKACWASGEENVTTDHLYFSLNNNWADATILPHVTIITYFFFLAEVVWPNLPVLSLRDQGDRDGLHRALPAGRQSHQRGQWGRHRRGRPRGYRADGERNGCTQEGVWRVHYEVFVIMQPGKCFITINLSSGRQIKCIDSHRSGEWVILRYASCPEVSSI